MLYCGAGWMENGSGICVQDYKLSVERNYFLCRLSHDKKVQTHGRGRERTGSRVQCRILNPMDAAALAVAAKNCADCKDSRPRYASVNLGIWLCNRCYGIHRSIGAHVTRTKCVGLDTWSPQELHRMKSIGNERAASYWESLVPAGYPRPCAKSTNEEVEKWIRDKYERKLFCLGNLPPPSVPEFQEQPTVSTSTTRREGRGAIFSLPPPKIHPVTPPPLLSIDDEDEEFGSFIQASS